MGENICKEFGTVLVISFLQMMTQVVAAAASGDLDSADLSPNLGCCPLIPFFAQPHSHMSESLLGCPLKSHTVSWSSCSQSWFLQSIPAPAGAVPLQPLVSAAPTVAHRHPLSPRPSTVAPISLSLETLDQLWPSPPSKLPTSWQQLHLLQQGLILSSKGPLP